MDVCRVGIGTPLQLVAATLRHHIHCSTGESAEPHIEGRGGDGHLVEGIEGDGRAVAGQVAADAEGVVEGSAVDRDMRLPVVAPANGDAVADEDTLRRETQQVVEAAAHGGHLTDGGTADVGGGTGMVDMQLAVAVAGDDHLMQLLMVILQLAAEQGALAHHEADVVKTLRQMTEIGDRDRVRTTGTETREMIFTLLVGDRMENVARGLMREGDGGTDGQFRARHHPSVETRCGHLSRQRSKGEECRQ